VVAKWTSSSATPPGDTELVQVCADLGNADTLARELQALADTENEYPQATRRLIVLNSDGVIAVKAPAVTVQPAYEWLLHYHRRERTIF
jgi:hypothetical protein